MSLTTDANATTSAAGLLGYRGIDVDTHYYEPTDCFSAYIDPKERALAVQMVTDPVGERRLLAGGRLVPGGASWIFATDKVSRPGSLFEVLNKTSTQDVGTDAMIDIQPYMVDPAARLEHLDSQGVEAIALFPTTAVLLLPYLAADPRAMTANLSAFNRWLGECWGYNRNDRLFAAPLVSFIDVEWAAAEVDRVLADGARIVCIPPGPASGRSPADPHFDPIWARLNEAGATAAYHIAESGYIEEFSGQWGEVADALPFQRSAFQWLNFYGDRPIMETLSALIYGNLFGRFPDVKVLSVENGSLWVPYLLHNMDKKKGMGRRGLWVGGRPSGRPSDIFREHVWVSPYKEDDIIGLIGEIGAARVVFGSDYPHPEGLGEPMDFAGLLDGQTAEDVRLVMRVNGADLLGLEA